MGWKIITNNKDKWEIFSSITDSVICECKTEKELVNHLALEAAYNGKLKAVETLMTFPKGWTVNDKRQFCSNNELDNYFEWVQTINNESKTYEEYYEKIDKKLEELLNGGKCNEEN